jgi:two-component system response regulator DegU
MNTAVRRSRVTAGIGQRGEVFREERKNSYFVEGEKPSAAAEKKTEARPRVYIAAENRLLREALSRMLVRRGETEVVGLNATGPFRIEGLIEEKANILLLTSSGSLAEDILVIRRVRQAAPEVRMLLVGMTGDEMEFFQYVRAGINGYLPRDASAEDVLEAMRAVQAGEAVCSGTLCALLFRFFEREASSLPSATVQLKLGLTRREQQIVPLVAQGLTNKEIANHFCLSEQTIKNHLYRMKHKIGAGDRYGIVRTCRTHGFPV